MYSLCFVSKPRAPERRSRHRPLCLVIEDDPLCRSLAHAQLRTFGMDVITAASSREAMAQVIGRKPSIVFIDNGLPDGDGYALARRIRRYERFNRAARSRPATLLVALSAHADGAHVRRCMDAGMDRVLSKPVSMASLAAVVGIDFDLDTTSARLRRPVAVLDLPAALRELYRANCLLDLAALRQALRAGDWRGVSACAHRIRGASLVVDAPVVAGIAAVLERCDSSSPSDVRSRRLALRWLERLLCGPVCSPDGAT